MKNTSNSTLDALRREVLLRRLGAAGAPAATHGVRATIPKADRESPLPPSWAQERLWFLDQLDKAASAAYHMSAGLQLKGRLDKAALRATLDRIVARHESLRTTFTRDQEDRPVLNIAPANQGCMLTEHDLRSLPSAERSVRLKEIEAEEASSPFDLAAGPLVRARLLHMSDSEHVLLLTQHHIISDGWSIGILIQEITALYTAFSTGRPDPLPELPIQYTDYAAWQRQWLDKSTMEKQIDFWRSHLQGAPALLEIPTDRPRPSVQSYAGGRIDFLLSTALSDALRTLGKRHGITPFMTFLTAWSVLLSRLSGQSDVVIGTPVANRPRAEVESLIGFFVNTLALRVRTGDDPDVATLLKRVRQIAVDAFNHQEVPLARVVQALQPSRTLGYNPIFQTMMGLQNTPAGAPLQLPDLESAPLDLPYTPTHFDLTLSLTESGDGIEGLLEYASDLFDAATIERLAEQFQVLLQGMVDDDTQRVSRLPLLSTAERERILVSFNRTARAFPHEALIHQLFEEQVRLQPDAIAVIHEAHSISYAALNERANQIAHHLVGLGLRPDDRVAICVERSIDMVAGLLGILKAGACYVPLDPAYPAERLSHMLRDSAPAALLTQRALLDALPQHTVPVLLLDDPDAAAMLRAYPAHNPDPLTLGLSSHNLAYVIYTSGSTGTPKGVMVEHRSVVNFWLELSRTTHSALPQRARIALNAAFSFDMSIKGLSQLLSGHCLVLVPQLIRASGAEMVHFLAHHRIDAFDSTPSQLEMLLTDGLLEHPDYVPRSVLLGGEPVSPSLWNRLRGCNSVRFYNMYGPTECTVDATIGLLQELGERPSIGRPIANTQVYLLDRQGQPVPIGVTGEIHIGGIGLARGYLGQPDLTAQRFIADPFGGTPHARLYKTGDLGRWLPDGTIEYLGRNDFQVKLRGFRIELGEIESQLRACPGVRDAVVIAREDQPGDKRLVAYLLAINDAPLAAAALRDQLATRLPDYMVPSAFVTLDAFPLTPNGKLDRHALPAPDANAIATREYAAPQGEIETTIAQIWQSLLGIERVGRHDDFFGLGGHSLLAVQMVSRLRQALGVEIALRELFVQTTLNKFSSAVLNHLRSELADSNLVAVRSHGNRPPIFLVHPIEGEIGYARELAACLDSERPVYALAATGLLKGEAPLASIPAMAARYVATIRKVQPQGPYHLAGWSAGGTIAYEMARQLIGADECVAFLGLIDTRADYRSANDEGTISASPSRMTEAEMLIDLASSLMSSQELVALQKLAAANRIEEMLRRCQEAGAIATDIDIDILRRHLGLRHATKNALLAYRPQALSVKVSLFTADEPARIDPLLGWASLPEVELRHVPIGGTHQSIVTHPHVKRLGAEVDQALLASPDVSNDTPELRYSPRITIQNGHRAAVPLFFVPGAGASVTTFFELTQALDLDIPIYGLQPRGLDGTLVPHIDVQSAARSYIKAVRDVAPDGQCHLVGHSYGGWIALDMGIRLKQAGVQVGALVLLDSDVPGSTLRQNIGDSEVDILICLIRHFEMSAQRSLNLRHQDLEGLSEAAQLELLLARLVDAKILPRQTRLQSLRGIVRVFRSNLNSHYAPSLPYTDDVHLVTATHDGATPPQNDEEPALVARWRSYAPKLEVWRSSGNHMTLLDTPHVKRLSDWLRQLVEKRPLPVSSMLK